MGLLEKASARRNLSKGGLRNRAEELAKQNGSGGQHCGGASTQEPEKKKSLQLNSSALTDLCNKIDSMVPSFEGIAELFEDIKQLFSIRKGALLTKSREDSFFLPRAQTGLDVTSRNRLRFPVDVFNSTKIPGWETFDDFSVLRPFLSSREYELIEDLRMLPLYADDEAAGMILLFGEEPDELDHVSLPGKDIEALQTSMGRYLQRNKLLHLGDSSKRDTSGSIKDLHDFLQRMESQNKVVTAIRFSLSRVLIRLSALFADVDLFRARRDSLRIIETLFEGNSRIIPLREDEYLLLLGTRHRPNPKLLQHQVRLALQNFFSDSEARIDFYLTDPPAPFDTLGELTGQYPPEN
ncbi:hypothetical protein [Marispirochaeta sp.]|uniref:hypothetical protein n=1 Tax=Marispirochaeta sp. TaxID=2038653 RepID=UPI0029C8D49E|nr:hypothetical protein [Marispirochaeta sp.]